MEIYVIGISKKGNNIEKVRLLQIENGKTEVRDLQTQIFKGLILKYPEVVKNATIGINGRIKGLNGQLERYGIIDKQRQIVILREIVDDKNNALGYLCADTTGKIAEVRYNQIVQLQKKLPIQNGKVVKRENGLMQIVPIKGQYERMIVQRNAQAKTDTDQENTTKDTTDINILINTLTDREIFKIIEELKKYNEYNKDIALKSVVRSVEGSGKIQHIQRKLILRKYVKLVKAKAKQSVQTPKVETQTPKVETQTPAHRIRDLNFNKAATADINLLSFVIHKDNKAYVKGLKDNQISRDLIQHIIIPDYITVNNNKYPVVGIEYKAFTRTNIGGITTGHLMEDIGQQAFKDCNYLKFVDTSKSRLRFIQAELCHGCSSLEDFIYSSTIERIHEYAFKDCKKLKYVKIPESCSTLARHSFSGCSKLVKVEHNLKYIQDSAFLDCVELREFSFDYILDIGQAQFRNTGFIEITLGNQLNSLGRKAFADCRKLTKVTILEGIQNCGEYAFAKPTIEDYRKRPRYQYQKHEAAALEQIIAPRQLIDIQVGSFKNVKEVRCYVGQATEQFCKAYTIPYTLIDSENKENSQTARIRSKILDQNPVEMLLKQLMKPVKEAQNPKFELKTDRLFKQPVELKPDAFKFFGFEQPKHEIEPNIRFKAFVNYLQDSGNYYLDPFMGKAFQYYNACKVQSDAIYFDGYNGIYKVQVTVIDDLTTGKFIVITQGNRVIGLYDCNMITDVEIGHGDSDDQVIPIKTFLHSGDKLGQYATISGVPAQGVFQDFGYKRVGEIMLNCLNDYGIKIRITRKDYYLYVPQAQNTVVCIHDECKYEEDLRTGKMIPTGNISDRYVVITKILTYEEFIKELCKLNKNKGGYIDFFQQINKMSDIKIQNKVESIKTIGIEREAHLYQIGKQFKNRVDTIFNRSLNKADINRLSPDLLTQEMFNGLQRQYWMVPKPTSWLRQVGKKSLNKKGEYSIGEYKIVEYVSNMIVKFSNPYMNGVKHAYVFEVKRNTQTEAVYASRYDLLTIVRKLYELVDYPDNITIPALMKNPDKIDEVNAKLFYNFYPVLNTKHGWDIKNFIKARYGFRNIYYVDFYIAMYKPTGVFYLVQYGWSQTSNNDDERNSQKQRSIVARPLFPIGNMNRALIVAATTNINQKNYKVLNELMQVQVTQTYRDHKDSIKYEPSDEQIRTYENYIQARRMIVNGITDAQSYRSLIDDRAVYMLGAVHKGQLIRETEVIYEDDSLDADSLETEDLGVDDLGVEDLGIDDLGVEDLGIEDLGVEDLGIEDLGVDKQTDRNAIGLSIDDIDECNELEIYDMDDIDNDMIISE